VNLPKKKLRIPTVIYNYHEINYWDWDYVVVIQPKVDTNMDNYEKEMDQFMEDYGYMGDIHEDNFGIYRGKLKLIDW
jgi:hypothetical protein